MPIETQNKARLTAWALLTCALFAAPAGAQGLAPLGADEDIDSLLACRPGITSPQSAFTQTGPSRTEAVQLFADNVIHETDTDLVTAAGHVEISQNGYILTADQVIYDPARDAVAASGNVTIIDPAGDVMFAESLELSGGFRDGFIKSVRFLLSDNSRLAAASATKEGARTDMEYAVYSPCQIDDSDTARAPMWRIRARRISHDSDKRMMYYRHAFLEFFGVPVLYSPYISHPDPAVKRKTGFLAPEYGIGDKVGVRLGIPFYYAIAPDKDATIAPVLLTDEGFVVSSEYRQRTRRGRFKFSGSTGRVDERDDTGAETGDEEFRGHVFGTGAFGFGRGRQWGFDLALASDDTYLRRFNISSLDTLTNRLYVEGLGGRRYAAANAYFFQGLEAEDQRSKIPIILPRIDYMIIGRSLGNGSRVSLRANLLHLYRVDGTDSRRVSLDAGWRMKRITNLGVVSTVNANLRGDLYHTNNLADPFDPTAPVRSGFEARVLPRLAFDWRLPLVRGDGRTRQIIEPVVSLVLSPNGGNPSLISNEDSVSFEFDDTNLFSTNRFTGLDRWENGIRANAGLKMGIYGPGGRSVSVLFGAGYRLDSSALFDHRSGLSGHRSDFVGRIHFAPSRFIDITHRFRLDQDSFRYRRNEVMVSAGPRLFRFNARFIDLDDVQTSTGITNLKQVDGSVQLRLNANWSASGGVRRDLENAKAITTNAGILYRNCCIEFGITFNKRFTRDRDVEPSTSVNFRLKLVNIG